MKKLSLALAAVLGLTVLTPVTAEAGGCRTRVTYDDCGYTLNWEYRFVGRDCHGCPVYQWVVVSRCAPPRHDYGGGYSTGGYYGGSRYSGGYNGGGYDGQYSGGRSCDSGYRSSGGSGIHFHWSR